MSYRDQLTTAAFPSISGNSIMAEETARGACGKIDTGLRVFPNSAGIQEGRGDRAAFTAEERSSTKDVTQSGVSGDEQLYSWACGWPAVCSGMRVSACVRA